MSVIHGDCIEVMAAMPEASVDAIVTDPPYGLEFMGKEWDRLDGEAWRTGGGFSKPGIGDRPTAWASFGQGDTANATCETCGGRMRGARKCECEVPKWRVKGKPLDAAGVDSRQAQGRKMQQWHEQWATAALRVAKPGAHLLAFGGTRTVHRMTVALEDAGWIIRDMLVWAYASGFPKSRALLKPAWEPIVMARKPGPLRELDIEECRIGTDEVGNPRDYTPREDRENWRITGGSSGSGATSPLGRWPANIVLTDPIFDGGWEGVVGGGETAPAGLGSTRGNTSSPTSWDKPGHLEPIGYGDTGTYSRFFLIPKASRSDREPTDPIHARMLHEQSGDCVKLEAWESGDRSPSEQTDSTSPERATSGDTHRATPIGSSSATSSPGSPRTDPSPTDTRSTTSTGTSRTTGSPTSSLSTPSPTSDSIPGASSGMESGGSPAASAERSSLWEPPTGISVVKAGRSTGDAGPATSPRSSRRSACERCGRPLPRVTTHPTVKPTELMRHLVRLVTPAGGTVLDPFLGSGTTALAAEQEGRAWVGIEREAEYVRIAEARLAGWQRGLGLEASA